MSTRCSTARGPARSPSLVTWPTRTTGTPVDLASRVSRSTHALTCAKLPADPGNSSSETVWMESTTTSAGWWRTIAASTATTSGPARASRFSGTAPIRVARPLTWDRRLLGRRQQAPRHRWRPPKPGPGRGGWTCRRRADRRPGSPNPARIRPRGPGRPRPRPWASPGPPRRPPGAARPPTPRTTRTPRTRRPAGPGGGQRVPLPAVRAAPHPLGGDAVAGGTEIDLDSAGHAGHPTKEL